MVSVINKTLWENVAPLVFFWIITPEIVKLKDFMYMLTRLSYNQHMEFIWRMMQPENLFLINSPEIQVMFDCISCSPQLRFDQIVMRRIGSRFLLLDRYTQVKQKIACCFKLLINYETETYTTTLISQYIQVTSPEIKEELFYHYNDIWINMVRPAHLPQTSMHLVMPPTLSIEERRVLKLTLLFDEDTRYGNMFTLQSTLDYAIMCYRDTISKRLMYRILDQLSELRQVLKNHPL